MNAIQPALDWLSAHGPSVFAILVGIALAVTFAVRRRGAPIWLGLAGFFLLFAAGGFSVSWTLGAWLAGAGLVLLVAAFGWLLASGGNWSPTFGWILAGLFAFGLGGLLTPVLHAVSVEAAEQLWGLRLGSSPPWLIFLGVLAVILIPAVIFLGVKSLSGLSPFRRTLAITLRCLVVLALLIALADPLVRRTSDNTTVLFLVDRSLSIPVDPDTDPSRLGRDLRWSRIKQFINGCAELRTNPADEAGVIVFGRRPRLVLPPSAVKKLPIDDELVTGIDPQYTDIAAALKLGLASFPEGTNRRVVLLSDGNENLGNALEQARANFRNVPIDVVPLAAGYRNENEVLVQSVDAPPASEGARLPIRVLIRNASPDGLVEGLLTLYRKSDGETATVPIIETEKGVLVPRVKDGERETNTARVQLKPGLNPFRFQDLGDTSKSFTYEAIFTPVVRVNKDGKEEKGLPGDRIQNNSATTHVVALAQRKVLFVESSDPSRNGSSKLLIDRLNGKGDRKFRVVPVTNANLPTDKTELGVYLSNYDCVVLGNLPADVLDSEQMEMIRANTYDQGCGLVMIGGDASFGAGGWQGTAVEKALPVDCDIKSMKVSGKGGLVLIMHASEMAEGNRWQKEIAKLAIRKLAPADMVGLIYYDLGAAPSWHIKFQQVGNEGNRAELTKQVDRMTPGDMPDFDPFLTEAHRELMDPKHNLAKRHIILISDGDPQQNGAKILPMMKADKVTCTTVGVATHPGIAGATLQKIANATDGRYYNPNNPKKLPAIYIKESRTVSQSFVHEKEFKPTLDNPTGPLDKMPIDLPPLYGFVRTSLKQSPLVQRGIMGPPTDDQEFPVMAWWQYGLGKSVAFTSDARTGLGAGAEFWDRDWARSDIYVKFWEQAIGWALRGAESGQLTLSTEARDGRVRVIIDAREKEGLKRPINDLRLTGGVTSPTTGKQIELKFVPKAAGQYEAEFKAEDSGSYFVNVQSKRTVKVTRGGKEVNEELTDSVRAGVTLPYSPEFADLESNSKLLEQLAAVSGSSEPDSEKRPKVYAEESITQPSVQREVFRPGGTVIRSLRPVWFWFAVLFAVLLLLDVAARRVAVEPAEIETAWLRTWDRLRGRGLPVATGTMLDRLRNRKEIIGQDIERDRTSRRFDPTTSAAPPPPGPDGELPPLPPKPKPKPPAPRPAGGDAEGGDYFSRMAAAKRKALRDREKPEEKGEG